MSDYTADYYKHAFDIFTTCTERMRSGSDEYADVDVTVSEQNLMERDVIQEMIEEQYDTINYAVMLIQQLERTRERLRGLC